MRLLVKGLGFASLFLLAGHVQSEGIPNVTVMNAEYKDVADLLSYPARVQSLRTVDVTAEVRGVVTSLPTRIGQIVRGGQVLLSLSNPDPAYAYKAFSVAAPFTGVVTRLDVVAGDRVAQDKVLLQITDNSTMKVIVNVVGDDLQYFRVGQAATLVTGKGEIPLRVKDISPQLDHRTGTAVCELEFAGTPSMRTMLPGSVVQTRFSINQRKALRLPERAIVYRGQDPFVIRVQEKIKAKYLAVKIVQQSAGLVEIEGPIRTGEQIIVNSSGFIVDGEAIQIR